MWVCVYMVDISDPKKIIKKWPNLTFRALTRLIVYWFCNLEARLFFFFSLGKIMTFFESDNPVIWRSSCEEQRGWSRIISEKSYFDTENSLSRKRILIWVGLTFVTLNKEQLAWKADFQPTGEITCSTLKKAKLQGVESQ